jgi:HAD superfamily hydrolase (TIGR01509 family)
VGTDVTNFSHLPGSAALPGWPLAAVFDCDGLLLDTAHCWHSSYRAAAAAAGCDLGGVDLDTLDGAAVAVAVDGLARALRRPIDEQVLRDALQHAVEAGPVAVMPGAEALLHAISERMPLAVASNAPAVVVRGALRRAGLDAFFSTIVSAEEVSSPKPHPAVYLEACRRLDVDPSDAVAFEDSIPGAAAARAAALLVVVVPSRRSQASDADLTVARLDDHRVFSLLGLAASAAGSRS